MQINKQEGLLLFLKCPNFYDSFSFVYFSQFDQTDSRIPPNSSDVVHSSRFGFSVPKSWIGMYYS